MISFLITLAIGYYFGFAILLFIIAILVELWPYIKIALIILSIYFAIKLFLVYRNKNKYSNKYKTKNKWRLK